MNLLHLTSCALICCAAFLTDTTSAADPPKGTARIILVGDSTVASGGGWGDAFAGSLKDGILCLNLGRNGRSSKSYRDEGHWKNVLEAKPEWVLIQFGHNDQPGKGPERETDAKTTFSENLKRYVSEVRSMGAKPVLVTSLSRRNFDSAGKIKADLLENYVTATKAVALQEKVPLIDLNARSVEQLNRMGPKAAVAFDAKSEDPEKPDRTHLSVEGARQSAELVEEEIRKSIPELAELLKP